MDKALLCTLVLVPIQKQYEASFCPDLSLGKNVGLILSMVWPAIKEGYEKSEDLRILDQESNQELCLHQTCLENQMYDGMTLLVY